MLLKWQSKQRFDALRPANSHLPARSPHKPNRQTVLSENVLGHHWPQLRLGLPVHRSITTKAHGANRGGGLRSFYAYA